MTRLARIVVLFALAMVGGTPAFADGMGGTHARSESAQPSLRRGRVTITGVANINNASEEVLELLPGIGPARAEQILDYRKAHPFKRAEELVKIKGIGRKTMAKLRPFVSVTGVTTLSDGKADRDDKSSATASAETVPRGAAKAEMARELTK